MIDLKALPVTVDDIMDAAELLDGLRTTIGYAVVGQAGVIEQVLIAGHGLFAASMPAAAFS